MSDYSRTETVKVPVKNLPEQTVSGNAELVIEGMSCTSCSAAVERAVKKLEIGRAHV